MARHIKVSPFEYPIPIAGRLPVWCRLLSAFAFHSDAVKSSPTIINLNTDSEIFLVPEVSRLPVFYIALIPNFVICL